MKRFLILSVLSTVFIVQFANAQVAKGNKMLGGNLGFSSKNSDHTTDGEVKEINSYIIPKLGFGISGHWVLGIDAQFNHKSKKANSLNFAYDDETNLYGVGVFARKFHQFNEQFGLFGEAGLNYAFGDEVETRVINGTTTEEKSKQHQYSINVHPGLFFSPTKKLFIEASFGDISYTYNKTTPPDGPKPTTKEFNISLVNNLSFGLFFVL